MTTNRRFTCDDLLRFNNVNLDVFTETVPPSCPGPALLRDLDSGPPADLVQRTPRSTASLFTCSTWPRGLNTSFSRRAREERARATVRWRQRGLCVAPLWGATNHGGGCPPCVQSWAKRRAPARTGTVTSPPSLCAPPASCSLLLLLCVVSTAVRGARLTHVTAQVAPEYRRQGLAQKLMGLLEETTIKRRVHRDGRWCSTGRLRVLSVHAPFHRHDGYFVDLFVRKSNTVAIGMYQKVLLSAMCAIF